MRIILTTLLIVFATTAIAEPYATKRVTNASGELVTRVFLDDQYQVDLPDVFVKSNTWAQDPLKGTFTYELDGNLIAIQFNEKIRDGESNLQAALRQLKPEDIEATKNWISNQYVKKLNADSSLSLLSYPLVNIFYIGETRVILTSYSVRRKKFAEEPNLIVHELFIWAVGKQYYVPIMYPEFLKDKPQSLLDKVLGSLKPQTN